MLQVIPVPELKIGNQVFYSGSYRTVTKVADYKGRPYFYGIGGPGFLGSEFPEQPLFPVVASHNVTIKAT